MKEGGGLYFCYWRLQPEKVQIPDPGNQEVIPDMQNTFSNWERAEPPFELLPDMPTAINI